MHVAAVAEGCPLYSTLLIHHFEDSWHQSELDSLLALAEADHVRAQLIEPQMWLPYGEVEYK